MAASWRIVKASWSAAALGCGDRIELEVDMSTPKFEWTKL